MKRTAWLAAGMAIVAVGFMAATAQAAAKPRTVGVSLPQIWTAAGPQESIKALRVAELDAARLLIERIYGVRVSASSSVYDLVLEDDRIAADIVATVKGITSTEDPEYSDDGTVIVKRAIKLRQVVEIVTRTLKEKKILGRVTLEDVSKMETENRDTVIDVYGSGALPNSAGLSKIQAKRAADLDAYRRLAERLMGFQISSETKVRDFVLESDKIAASVASIIRGANPVDIRYKADNSCEVDMQIKMADVVRVIRYHSKKGEESLKISTEVETRTFKETGRGAPRPEGQRDVASTASTGSEDEAVEIVMKRVIASGVVIE